MAVRRKKADVVDAPKAKDPLLMGKEVLKLVEAMKEEKRISPEVIFTGIEQAIQLAALRHFAVEVHDRRDRAIEPGPLFVRVLQGGNGMASCGVFACGRTRFFQRCNLRHKAMFTMTTFSDFPHCR